MDRKRALCRAVRVHRHSQRPIAARELRSFQQPRGELRALRPKVRHSYLRTRHWPPNICFLEVDLIGVLMPPDQVSLDDRPPFVSLRSPCACQPQSLKMCGKRRESRGRIGERRVTEYFKSSYGGNFSAAERPDTVSVRATEPPDRFLRASYSTHGLARSRVF